MNNFQAANCVPFFLYRRLTSGLVGLTYHLQTNGRGLTGPARVNHDDPGRQKAEVGGAKRWLKMQTRH